MQSFDPFSDLDLPVPFWHVTVSAINGRVRVEASDGVNQLLEAHMNETRFEWRVQRLRRKWQRWCDRRNERDNTIGCRGRAPDDRVD